MNDDTGTMPDQDVPTDTAGTTDAPSEAAQEAARIRQEAAARREAGTLLAEATRLSQEAAEEADRVLVSAQDTAERLVEEAREDLEQQRARARAEVTAELREEVAALRARTESLVEELRSTLGELGGLLGGAKSTVEHVLRTASDLDEVGRRIAAHDQRTAAAQPTAAGAPIEAPSVPDRSEDRDDRGEAPAVTPAQTPRAMEAVQLVGDQSTSEHTPAVVADGTSPEPVSTAGAIDADDFSPRFDIDLGVCVYCGYCVEVCPEDAIRMDTGILDLAAYSREAMRLDIHELMDPQLRKPLKDCGLEFPHQCGLADGEMTGSWQEREGS